jgi:hypothetical protein
VFGRQVTTLVSTLLLAGVALAPGRPRAASPEAERALPDGAPELALDLPERGEAGLALTIPDRRDADLRVDLAATKDAKKAPSPSSMDFDLLGEPAQPKVPTEDPSLRTRRKMLNWHQGLGLGLFGLQLASTVTGQLNYNDKFGVANTGRYTAPHAGLVVLNVAAFATVGAIALFAPTEKNAPPRPFGRTSVHKIAMGLATVGMLAQTYLGVRTTQREGYLDKQSYGRAHLAVGYATLAAMTVGVGVIVF